VRAMNCKPPWTPEQIDEIRRLYLELHSLRRVATQLDCHWTTVAAVIPREMIEAVTNAARRGNHRKLLPDFTAEQKAEAVRLYAELTTVAQVARALHTGERRVRKALLEAGVLRRQGGRTAQARGSGASRGPPIVGCAIPRTAAGRLFCAVCTEPLPPGCDGACMVGSIHAGECPLMAACPCAHEATAKRWAAFREG